MTFDKLKKQLELMGVNPAKYNLYGGIPNASEGIVLSIESGRWIVKHFERGSWYVFDVFETEADACDKVLELLDDKFYRL